MTTTNETPAGEFRRPTPSEIAFIARWASRQQRIKQAVLAQTAHVSEKTVERLEKGDAVLADDTYRRLAEALGLAREAFTEVAYHPSLEEVRAAAAEQQAKLEAENIRTAVRPVRDPRVFISFFGAHAMLVDDSQIDTDDLEVVYAFRENLRDCGDIAGDVPDTSRLAYATDLLEELRAIEQLGYAALTIDKGVTTTKAGNMEIELGVLVLHKVNRANPELPKEMWLPRNHPIPW
jgi:plasmid maintenance system antidote protein VapI